MNSYYIQNFTQYTYQKYQFYDKPLMSSESQDNSQDQSDIQEKKQRNKPKVERLDKMKNLKKIIINVSMTQYPVVSEVAELLNWKIQYSNDSGDWDVFWTDFHVEPDVLIKMHLFQKINHYPGIHTLARKNLLGLNLMGMREKFPEQYNFFPLTWMLPQQYVEFRTYFQSKQKGKTRTYIVKPEADCQGRGIFLTRKLNSIQNGKHYVVQRYIARPYLLDGLKFDLRIYVLLGSVNPLRIYLYQEGLARFATQKYIQPTTSNLQKQYMHLTNYAINKNNPKFIFNNNSSNMGIGHKRSLGCVFKQLQEKGLQISILKSKIKDVIIKTIITGLPLMKHQYKCSQPEDYTGNMCFHILGLDIMLNCRGDPVLLEVNHTPSFTTDTPLDYKIKKGLIKDTLVLMNINLKKKNQLYLKCQQNNQTRLLTGKRNILQGKQRQEMYKNYQNQRQIFQQKNLGGFQVIYPTKNQELMSKYQSMIEGATKQHFDQKDTVKAKIAQKQAKRLAKEQYKELKAKSKQEKQQAKLLKQKNQTKQTKESLINKKQTKIISNSEAQPLIQRSTIQISEQENNNSKLQVHSEQQIETKQPNQKFANKRQNFTSRKKFTRNPNKNSSIQKLTELPNIQQTSASEKHQNKSNLMKKYSVGQKTQNKVRGNSIINFQRAKKLQEKIQKAQALIKNSAFYIRDQYMELQIQKTDKNQMSKSKMQEPISINTIQNGTVSSNTQKRSLRKNIAQYLLSRQDNNQKNKIRYNQQRSAYDDSQVNSIKMGILNSSNGGFVMPKMYCLNFESEKKLTESSNLAHKFSAIVKNQIKYDF